MRTPQSFSATLPQPSIDRRSLCPLPSTEINLPLYSFKRIFVHNKPKNDSGGKLKAILLHQTHSCPRNTAAAEIKGSWSTREARGCPKGLKKKQKHKRLKKNQLQFNYDFVKHRGQWVKEQSKQNMQNCRIPLLTWALHIYETQVSQEIL